MGPSCISFTSITFGLYPPCSPVPSSRLSGWLIRLAIVSPHSHTPPDTHLDEDIHLERVPTPSYGGPRATVNGVISARIVPIPHNLSCSWHLALKSTVWGHGWHSICQQTKESWNMTPLLGKLVNRHLIICVYPLKLQGHYGPVW